jgi:peptidoglycan/xylan/chitin deacetylase (PgdA/CDA1 family)
MAHRTSLRALITVAATCAATAPLSSCRHAMTAPGATSAGPPAAPAAATAPATATAASATVEPASAASAPAAHAAGCAELRAGAPAVSLTYDDSLPSQLATAAPALARRGLSGTFFIEDVRPDDDSWRQLRAAGHELGSHTLHHPCPRVNTWVKPGFASEDYDVDRMTAELDESVALLRALGQSGPLSFAYPCGVMTVGEQHHSYVPLVKERFAAARGVQAVVAMGGFDPYDTPGNFMTGSGALLVARVKAAARGPGGWVIFGFHGVGGDHLSVTAEAHEELLAYLAAHRDTVWTAPFGTVAACYAQARGDRQAAAPADTR